jgi:DNA-directed RNA polymerase specialized sigma24 family protein
MPDKTRQAMALVLAGFTFAEVAEQLGTTERAVEGRLYRYRTERSRRRDAGGAR